MPLPDPARIFLKAYVQLPMQIVLNPPMATYSFGIVANPQRAAANIVPHLGGGFPFNRSLAATHAHHLQLGPGLAIPEARHLMDHDIGTVLLTTMALLLGSMLQDKLGRKLSSQRLLQRCLHIRQQ